MSSLLDAVTAEAAVLEHFVAILDQEQKLLINGNVDAVHPLLEQKSALIAELNAIGQRREAALSALGIAADRQAIEAWLVGAAPEIKTAWDKLMELARTANRFNSNNGQIINTRMQYNQQALAALMGAADAAGSSTYGPDGHQRHDAGSRPPLGQA